MCLEGWCVGWGFQLLSDVLEAVDAGGLPRLAFCVHVADALGAPGALYVCGDVESQRLTCTGWPNTVDAPPPTIVVEYLWRTVPSLVTHIARDNTPSCVSLDGDSLRWPGSVADLLLWEVGRYTDVAQLPLNVVGPELRLLALFRRRSFSRRDMHLLRTVHGPLSALDHLFDRVGHEQHDVCVADTGATAEPDVGVGGYHLTPREVEVLSMVAEGLLARSIAIRLRVSTRTVHKHLGNVYRKLEAPDRLLAVARAQSLGLIPAQHDPRGRR